MDEKVAYAEEPTLPAMLGVGKDIAVGLCCAVLALSFELRKQPSLPCLPRCRHCIRQRGHRAAVAIRCELSAISRDDKVTEIELWTYEEFVDEPVVTKSTSSQGPSSLSMAVSETKYGEDF